MYQVLYVNELPDFEGIYAEWFDAGGSPSTCAERIGQWQGQITSIGRIANAVRETKIGEFGGDLGAIYKSRVTEEFPARFESAVGIMNSCVEALEDYQAKFVTVTDELGKLKKEAEAQEKAVRAAAETNNQSCDAARCAVTEPQLHASMGVHHAALEQYYVELKKWEGLVSQAQGWLKLLGEEVDLRTREIEGEPLPADTPYSPPAHKAGQGSDDNELRVDTSQLRTAGENLVRLADSSDERCKGFEQLGSFDKHHGSRLVKVATDFITECIYDVQDIAESVRHFGAAAQHIATEIEANDRGVGDSFEINWSKASRDVGVNGLDGWADEAAQEFDSLAVRLFGKATPFLGVAMVPLDFHEDLSNGEELSTALLSNGAAAVGTAGFAIAGALLLAPIPGGVILGAALGGAAGSLAGGWIDEGIELKREQKIYGMWDDLHKLGYRGV